MTPRKQSADLMMFRRVAGEVELFLVHPGGPFFARKDAGAWSIPKGEVESGEDTMAVARREFLEETGQSVEACLRTAGFISLASIVQRGGKTVHAWAFDGDWPAGAALESNRFSIEWPRGSGRHREFPEVDRGEFFSVSEA